MSLIFFLRGGKGVYGGVIQYKEVPMHPHGSILLFHMFIVVLRISFKWSWVASRNSSNVNDIDEYIVDISKKEGIAEGISEIDGGVTVHHACHARAQNMGNKARDMLKLIPNIKMDIVERCAGHGGTFGVMKTTHDIANKFGQITADTVKKNLLFYLTS